jgi:hypothetical protein
LRPRLRPSEVLEVTRMLDSARLDLFPREGADPWSCAS